MPVRSYRTGTAGTRKHIRKIPRIPIWASGASAAIPIPMCSACASPMSFPPLPKGSGFLSRIVNGYQLNGFYRYNSGQPFQAYQPLSISNQFGPDTSFCDTTFQASTVGSANDTCLPPGLLQQERTSEYHCLSESLRRAQPEHAAYTWTTTLIIVDANGVYHAGTPVDPSSSHWIINNQAEALAIGNPYPGSGRNILRAQPFNNLDASIYKNTKLTERVTLQLQVNAYNALNHADRSAAGDTPDGSAHFKCRRLQHAGTWATPGLSYQSLRVFQPALHHSWRKDYFLAGLVSAWAPRS